MLNLIGSPWIPFSILLIATLVSRFRGGWLTPAAFVGLLWSAYIGASLAVVDYPVPARGLWMLVLLILAMQIGGWLANEVVGHGDAAAHPGKLPPIPVDTCRNIVLLSTLVALIGCVHFVLISLEEFNLPFTPIGILEVGARWTVLRYEEAVEPWSVRLLIMWLHPAALLGGILFVFRRTRFDRWTAILSLLPAFIYGIVTGSRAAILIGLTCWVAGYLTMVCVRTAGHVDLFSRKRVAQFVLVPLGLTAIFAGIDTVRDTSWVHSLMLDVQAQKLENYVLGPPAAFADWYAHANDEEPEWGARTFAGEFDLLGIRKRISGRYLETSNVVGTESTNVYTLFRGLIEDFTPIGAIIAALLGGVIAQVLYAKRHNLSPAATLALAAFYGTVLYSPIVSFFSYNGVLLAWIVAAAVCLRASHAARAVPATTSFVVLESAE